MRTCLLVLSAVCSLSADIRFGNLLADHMVLQRDFPVHVWGTASPDETVSVTFRGTQRGTKADALGRWSLYLPPGDAGGPFELIAAGTNSLTLRDVMVGDVWIAAGQSNMEWPVAWAANPEQEKAAASYPGIRLVRTMHRVRDYPVSEFVGQTWTPCTPQSVEHFSAVGYHFARLLQPHLKIPIGVIQTAWGGTPLEAWTSLQGLASDPGLMPIFTEWARVGEGHETALLRHRLQADEWARASARARNEGKTIPAKPEMRTGPGGPWTPTGLFNGMVAPLTRMPIRGVIWYQGESNTSPERAPVYERLFPAMIQDWRRAWGQGDFPFLYVQLANYRATPDSLWPEIREAQRLTLSLRNTAMAVTTDIGNPEDIHPGNKRDVAARLALAARAVAYGEAVPYSGPLFRQATIEGSAIRVWFDHGRGLRPRTGSVRGFEIAGRDGRFVPADAAIDGNTVIVQSTAVAQPLNVRYSWADNPDGNLENDVPLPASPFRTRNR